jgi:hypothetical protein
MQEVKHTCTLRSPWNWFLSAREDVCTYRVRNEIKSRYQACQRECMYFIQPLPEAPYYTDIH